MAPAEDLKAKALDIHHRLCGVFGCPIPSTTLINPVIELVSSLLFHRTRNADSGRAFKALRARYPTWEALCEAPTSEVQATIAGVTWPDSKRRASRQFSAPSPSAAARSYARFLGRQTGGGRPRVARKSPRHRPEDERGGPQLQPAAQGGGCRSTGIITASRNERARSGPHGRRFVTRGARGAAAADWDAPSHLRPSRSLHAAWSAMLLSATRRAIAARCSICARLGSAWLRSRRGRTRRNVIDGKLPAAG